MMDKVARRNAATPWGNVTAVLAACFATLTGLARGLDPDVILFRALVAATLVGALATIASRVLHKIGEGGSRR